MKFKFLLSLLVMFALTALLSAPTLGASMDEKDLVKGITLVGDGADSTNTAWKISALNYSKGWIYTEVDTVAGSVALSLDVLSMTRKFDNTAYTASVSGGDSLVVLAAVGSNLTAIPDSVLTASPVLNLRFDPTGSASDTMRVWVRFIGIKN